MQVDLHTVTLTVNEVCNMACEHCYLTSPSFTEKYVSDSVIDKILNGKFKHLALVGKEVLYNEEHAMRTNALIKKAVAKGFEVSIVTNGKNLHFLDEESIRILSHIDISFDGGPKTYHLNRQNTYENLKKNIERLALLGAKSINALNVLFMENIDNLEDIFEINKITLFNNIMLSPYLRSLRFGNKKRTRIKFEYLCKKLSESKSFMGANNAYLFVEKDHLDQENLDRESFMILAKKYGIAHKVKILDKNPLHYGLIRITSTGKVLTPQDCIHTKLYALADNLNDTNDSIEKQFEQLLHKGTIIQQIQENKNYQEKILVTPEDQELLAFL